MQVALRVDSDELERLAPSGCVVELTTNSAAGSLDGIASAYFSVGWFVLYKVRRINRFYEYK